MLKGKPYPSMVMVFLSSMARWAPYSLQAQHTKAEHASKMLTWHELVIKSKEAAGSETVAAAVSAVEGLEWVQFAARPVTFGQVVASVPPRTSATAARRGRPPAGLQGAAPATPGGGVGRSHSGSSGVASGIKIQPGAVSAASEGGLTPLCDSGAAAVAAAPRSRRALGPDRAVLQTRGSQLFRVSPLNPEDATSLENHIDCSLIQ